MATTEETKTDAANRGWRSLGQAAIVTAVVGAVTGAHELIAAGDGITLEGVGVAAATGAGIALSAWIQRRIEGTRKDAGGGLVDRTPPFTGGRE